MRKIINFTHATLDGYIDNPHEWSLEYASEGVHDYGLQMHLAVDAMLLGRVTYEGMAQAWPNMSNPLADHVNSITKYVVASQPVDTTAWDPTVVIAGCGLIEEITRLKQGEGGDILIWGTGQLTDTLAAAGLLDEYRISTVPVIKGDGEPLFRPARVNPFEADFLGNHCVVVGSSLGSLIHTAVGSAGGWGGLRTNRSGWMA